MGDAVMEEEKAYSSLKDLKFEINGEDGGAFCICFWVYLQSSASFPCVLLHQVHPDITCSVPFLVLNEKMKLMLFPLLSLHHEAPSPADSTPWAETKCAFSNSQFPLKKWVHVGCEVSVDFVRLHLDGAIVGERPLCSAINKDSNSHDSKKVSLAYSHQEADESLKAKGYVHGVEVLPPKSSIQSYCVKDPPPLLSIDSSSATDIEEDDAGVWSIVGGKSSGRRNFSLDVMLLDAVGQPVNKEFEVVASLFYADSEAPVEKPDDAEAPLLTSYDGIEFASWDRPSKLVNGRASFKLKISQLSSKCDNKLFRIRFDIPKLGKYPFLETFSHPIRCISRNCNPRTSSFMWKNSNSPMHLLDGSQSFGMDEGSLDIVHNTVSEAKQRPSSKRVKFGQEKPFAMFKVGISSEQNNKGCSPSGWTSNKGDAVYRTSSERRPEIHVNSENSSSESESSEATISISHSMSNNRTPVSDSTVFKYCVGSLTDKSLLLKEIAVSASEQELGDFARQVSIYSGCSHHWHQIVISKRLIEDGVRTWNLVSQNNHHVLWENLAPEIEEQFKKISCCNTRYLSLEDLEVLRRIAGCQELVARENFEKLWCWLYPVAFTISQEWINAIWDSVLPKWIEGLITKEEAESSLQGPGGLQDPGTFVLRFPTSRCWPHPDSGNLVVTYVGSDYNIHHRLLSLDLMYSSVAQEMTSKPLKEILLEQNELSRLGRIRRIF